MHDPYRIKVKRHLPAEKHNLVKVINGMYRSGKIGHATHGNMGNNGKRYVREHFNMIPGEIEIDDKNENFEYNRKELWFK